MLSHHKVLCKESTVYGPQLTKKTAGHRHPKPFGFILKKTSGSLVPERRWGATLPEFTHPEYQDLVQIMVTSPGTTATMAGKRIVPRISKFNA